VDGVTVALPVAISTEVAFVLVSDILPLAPLLASFFTLIYIVVELTVPLLFVNVKLEPKPDPDVVDISYPVGAETDISASKFAPDTVKLCSLLSLPEHVEKDENDEDVDI
jgi:hypothetical protein